MEKENDVKNHEADNPGSRELIITRIFDAPPELVWKAWTEPQHFKKWWGPKDYTSPHCKMDLKVGGRYHACMRSAEGQEFWSSGTYREIEPMKKIVFTDSFADAEGNLVPASYYKMPGEWPMEMLVSITFEALADSKTKMTLRHSGLPAGQMLEMTGSGWNESFDKLAESLKH
jgi:uncharacterized protein YndB with AHSA1/START domain